MAQSIFYRSRAGFVEFKQQGFNTCSTCKATISTQSAEQIHCPGSHSSMVFCGVACYEHHVHRAHAMDRKRYSVADRLLHGSLPFVRSLHASLYAKDCRKCVRLVPVQTHFLQHHMQMEHGTVDCDECFKSFVFRADMTVATAWCRWGCNRGPFCSHACAAAHKKICQAEGEGALEGAKAPSDPEGALAPSDHTSDQAPPSASSQSSSSSSASSLNRDDEKSLHSVIVISDPSQSEEVPPTPPSPLVALAHAPSGPSAMELCGDTPPSPAAAAMPAAAEVRKKAKRARDTDPSPPPMKTRHASQRAIPKRYRDD